MTVIYGCHQSTKFQLLLSHAPRKVTTPGQQHAGYRTGDSVIVSIPLCPSRLPCNIVQIRGKPSMSVYRLRCQYGTLKRCYKAELLPCPEVVLSTDASGVPVGLRDVARRFKADCGHDLKPASKKRKFDVDLTCTSPATVGKREVWIAFKSGLVLCNEHRRMISDGEWLSDMHINVAQALLK